MIAKIIFEIRAVSCLLAQGNFQPPLRTVAIRIANAARLLDETKVTNHISRLRF